MAFYLFQLTYKSTCKRSLTRIKIAIVIRDCLIDIRFQDSNAGRISSNNMARDNTKCMPERHSKNKSSWLGWLVSDTVLVLYFYNEIARHWH